MKRNTRDKVLELRVLGRSIPEISRALGIAKSSVTYWLNKSLEMRLINEKLKAESRAKNTARLKTYVAGRQEYWKKWRQKFIQEARDEFDRLKSNPLFIAGISLYWGEGDSNPKNPLRLSNVNPGLIKVYVEFLLRILKVSKEKIRIGIIAYPEHDSVKVGEYWAKLTGVPRSQFQKTQVIRGKHPTKRLEYGVCMVIVNTRGEKYKVQEWIEIFSKMYYNGSR